IRFSDRMPTANFPLTQSTEPFAGTSMTVGNDVGFPGSLSVLGTTEAGSRLNSRVLWANVVSSLESSLDPQLFAAWIKPLEVEQCSLEQDADGSLVLSTKIAAPNKFCAEHVQNNYGTVLISALSENCDCDEVRLSYTVRGLGKGTSPKERFARSAREAAVSRRSEIKPQQRRKKRAARPGSTINPDYNFNNFVVGACNQFAHAVSARVSRELGGSYNPLFIYGGVGLGKTHLANAIGNVARKEGKKALLMSSESFVNELITALRSNKMQQFKERFRSLDLLVIDDIQFIIGKECTQEEFFHTFNALHQRKSQIVLTSDKIPQELTGLEERLKTRFSSGIAVDLQAPDFETRVAILMQKSEAKEFEVSLEVAQFLAEKIDSNVRELEGALNRLQAICALNNELLTVDLAEDALRTIVPGKTREITIELIQKVVAERFGTTVKDLLGKRRTQNIALPRQVAMYLCRKLTTCSYPEIGALFGGRDHSTVIHANRVVAKRITTDGELNGSLDWLERKLKGKA
ncbi:MAG: chromosomal replication initiator protein DnaA, partial [Bdellovibrionales bacterium]|nr:chromosomal replication initiator protein DnaA [Bdellovibrionales bacterium]